MDDATAIDVKWYLVDTVRSAAFEGDYSQVQMVTYRVMAPSADRAVELVLNKLGDIQPIYEGEFTDVIVIGIEADD